MSQNVTTNKRSLALAVITTAVLSYTGNANAQTTPTNAQTATKPINGTYVGSVKKTVNTPKTKKTAGSSFSSELLTNAQIFNSTQSIAKVTPKQAKIFGPNASSTAALSILPGVYLSGPDGTGVSNRSTISIRGIQVGVTSYSGNLEYNGITGLFDGIPMQNLDEGKSFHTVETPIGSLISGINTIYGPGNPRSRWFDSIGGTINFLPVQPSRYAKAKAAFSYGSFGSKIVSASADTGRFDGWSAVIAGAYAHGHSFRTGAYLPSHNEELFFKLRKHYNGNSYSFGAYYAGAKSYRPNQIPLSPIPGVTLNGLPNGTPYSQSSTGFYSTLPTYVWHKIDQEHMFLLYGRQRLKIASNVNLTNEMWYRNSVLHHYGVNNLYPPNNNTGAQITNWYTNTYGDKLDFGVRLPMNRVAFGGYVIAANTNVNGFSGNNLTGNPIPGFEGNPYPGNPTSIMNHTYIETYASGFLQDRITPLPGLTIVPGLDFMDFQTHFFQNASSIAAEYPNASYNTSPSLAKEFQRWEPSLGINYKLLRNVAIYGNYSVTYQNPTAGNFNAAAGPLTELGTLYPVKSDDYEAGFRFHQEGFLGLDDVFADVNYFHDQLSNETIPVTSPTNPLYTIFSYGNAILNGVNLSLDAKIDHDWSMFSNVGFIHAYYTQYFSTADNQSYNGAPVSATPDVTANIGVTYTKYLDFARSRVSATVFDQYYGSQFIFNNNDGAPSFHQKIGGYNVVNLELDARTSALNGLIPGIRYTALSLNVTNLFNREYNSTADITGGGYFNTNTAGYEIVNPGAPRAVFGTLSFAF